MPTRTELIARRPAVWRRLCFGALASLLFAPAWASAQSGYGRAPFLEQPVAVAQAAALERLQVAARALEVQPAAEDDEESEGEEDEGGPLGDFGLFRASLAAVSPELAQLLGIGSTVAYELAARNELPIPVFKIGRKYYAFREHYDAFKVSQLKNRHTA